MRASLEQHLGSRQVGKVVYGSIIGLALVVAIESHPPKPGVMAVWLLGTALAVGLAEIYSEVVGAETSTRQPVTRHQLRHMFEDAARSRSASPSRPCSSCSRRWASSRSNGVHDREVDRLGLIGFYGFWAARFAGATRRALLKGLWWR